MFRGSPRKYQHVTKVVLVSAMTCSLLLPQGFIFADSSYSSETTVSNPMKLAIAAGEISASGSVTPDPTKVKFTKEQAVAKVKSLFPILEKAQASNITLGNNYTSPPQENQMVWDIQWNYQIGNSGYGFNSQVDAITGDLISTYVSFPNEENIAYYPPKLSKEEALEKVKIFISKAATSVSSKDLQLENTNPIYANSSLFGPVQYSFHFNILKNGILSQSDYMSVTIDANGNVMQFSKSSDDLEYPSSTAKITKTEADKQFNADMEVRLQYTPIFKSGQVTDWILSYQPVEYSVYSIDAISGKKISYDGTTVSSAPVTYSEIPQSKEIFAPRKDKNPLSAEEAAKRVQEVVNIPEGRTLLNQSLSSYYRNPEQQAWNLNWGERNAYFGMSEQTSAVVDATTGEILEYRINDYGSAPSDKEVPVPSGLAKLTTTSAKQRAIDLINQLYSNASNDLKLVNHDDSWSFLKENNQYRYEFQRFHNGIMVGDGSNIITFDQYGRLQSYSKNRTTGLEKITATPSVKVTKEEALEAYRNQYTMKLQYSRFGGYYTNNLFTKAEVRLVYTPTPNDITKTYQILDAVSGNWVTRYEGPENLGNSVTPTDIKGHSAEKALRTFVDYGILTPSPDGKLNPDQTISVSDWLTMIVKASTPYYESYYNSNDLKPVAGINPEDPNYGIVNYAVERKWIKNDTSLQLDKELTREQLAIMLTSIVNYNKMASFLSTDTSVNQLNDASAINNKGAVALSMKLGIMEAQNGSFLPQQTVTKAQAASVIMKLVLLQGRTDQLIGQR